ncbi:MAG: hypothetical protein MZU91_12785 [Desulfosudis oleivorans]|nr:hypothetical protein [Desulfosudis oleivorans]
MLEPTDLVQLPKGEAFALIHGGQLHKIRMPLPSASSDPLMPDEPRGDRRDAARAPRRALESAGGPPPNRRVGVSSRNAAFHDGALAGRAAEPAEAGLLAGPGSGRAPAVRLDRRLGVRVQGLAAGDRAAARSPGARSCGRHCACRSAGRRRRRHHRAGECPVLDRVRGHRHPRHGHAVRQRVSPVDPGHDHAAQLCLAPGGHRGGDGRHPAARRARGNPGAVRAAAPASVRGRRRRWVHPACDPPGLRRTRVGQPVPPGEVPAVGGAGAGRGCPADVAGAGAVGTVRGAGRAADRRLGECAVGVLQEAHVDAETPERVALPNIVWRLHPVVLPEPDHRRRRWQGHSRCEQVNWDSSTR